jgi:hypothetical protein
MGHDDWAMTVWGSGGKPGISSIRELNSPGLLVLCQVLAEIPSKLLNGLLASKDGKFYRK